MGERDEWDHVMGLLSDWMWIHSAFVFTMAMESMEPHSLICTGVSRSETASVMSYVSATPERYGPPIWLERGDVGSALVNLLPCGQRKLTET